MKRLIGLTKMEARTYNEDGTVKQSTIGKYNEKYGDASGNYVFIRAHDNNVQDIIAEIIKKEINPKSDGFTITDAEMKQAFEIYNKDMLSSDKKYTLKQHPSGLRGYVAKHGNYHSCLLWRPLYR